VTTPRARQALRWLLPCLLCIFSVFADAAYAPRLASAAVPTPPKLKPHDDYALIFGTVWGPDDRPVYGIRVKIRRAKDKHAKWDLMSDHHGEFAQRVPAGEADYVVWADLKGVKTAEGKPVHLVKDVDVHIDYDERVDIGLHLAP